MAKKGKETAKVPMSQSEKIKKMQAARKDWGQKISDATAHMGDKLAHVRKLWSSVSAKLTEWNLDTWIVLQYLYGTNRPTPGSSGGNKTAEVGASLVDKGLMSAEELALLQKLQGKLKSGAKRAGIALRNRKS